MNSPSGPVPRPGHLDCVCGFAEQAGRVLLVRNRRRIHGVPTPCWDLPGGRVEPGESLPAALAREWTEETHLVAQVGALFLVEDGVVRESADAPVLRTWRTTYFEVESDGVPTPDDGVEAAEWVPRAQVLERLTAPYHGGLRAYLGGRRERHAHVTWINRQASHPHGLTNDTHHLCAMTAAGACGNAVLVARHAEHAIAHGASEARVAEALLQLAPYCGFPRTLAALGAATATWSDGAPHLPEDIASPERAPRGQACFDAVYADRADEIRARLVALHPHVQQWIESFAYGRVLAREGLLTLVERELLAVSMLTTLGQLAGPLLGHMRAAHRLGASIEQLRIAIQAAALPPNDPRENTALGLLERL